MPVPAPDVLAPLLAPIPGDAPAGRDLRYDARYDAVREARREDAELPDGGLATERKVADWARVQKDTADLLGKESKDLNLAAWHAEALLRRAGVGGLAGGLTVLTGLLDQFWDGLYPEVEDGDVELRLGPLEWVGSRLDMAVRQAPIANGGLTFLSYRESRLVPTEAEAEANGEKRTQRAERLAEGRLAPEAATAAIAATPKAFYKTLVADVTAAVAALDELERVSDERFEDDPPSFRGLRAALDEVQRFAAATLAQKLVDDPDPIVEEASADGAGADGTGGDASGGAGANGTAPSLAAEPVSATDAAARVAASARYLRQQDPTAPASYLLLRGLRWGEIRSADGRVDPRLLEAPPAGARTRLRALLLDGKWAELLEAGEQLMATPAGRGWLDLQRYTLTACSRLGPSYSALADAVRGELGALLAAAPDLPYMTLMDDLPAANAETQAWLAEEQLGADGQGAENSDADSELPDGSAAFARALDDEAAVDVLVPRSAAVRGPTGGRRRADHGRNGAFGPGADGQDAFALARAELARGRTNRAVELLVAELDQERSARGRFVRQTQIAQILVEAGLPAVAEPILQQLVETITERSLEQWEAGPLVAQPLALMCRVIDATEGSAGTREELYLRVCRLDPLQAMALRAPAAG